MVHAKAKRDIIKNGIVVFKTGQIKEVYAIIGTSISFIGLNSNGNATWYDKSDFDLI